MSEMGPNMSDIERDSTDCMEMPQDSQSWSIIFEGVLSVIVGLCGLLGNAATITGHFNKITLFLSL